MTAEFGFGGAKLMVKTIDPHEFDMELQSGDAPFLVAFLKRNERFREQTKALDSASEVHADHVRCYMYSEDYLDTAMQRLLVKGTPTFLLFDKGREVGRLMGESDRETLDEFIRNAIPEA